MDDQLLSSRLHFTTVSLHSGKSGEKKSVREGGVGGWGGGGRGGMDRSSHRAEFSNWP